MNEGGQAIAGNLTQDLREPLSQKSAAKPLALTIRDNSLCPSLKKDNARQSSFGRATSEERMGNRPRNTGPMLTSQRCGAKLAHAAIQIVLDRLAPRDNAAAVRALMVGGKRSQAMNLPSMTRSE